MRFNIARHLPQRLLVRCGKYVFTREEGYGLSNYLTSIEGIDRCRTNEVNGSLLIEYQAPMTGKKLLRILRAIDINEIEVVEPDQHQLVESTNQDFYMKLSKMVAIRYAVRGLLPMPLGLAYQLVRYAPILKDGLKSLFKGKLNLEVLDATAIGLAFARGDIGTAGSIMFLLGVSDELEHYTRTRAKTELKESLAMHVKDVWIRDNGEEREVPLSHVKMGDVVVVRTGAMIPIDGKVIEGLAMVNEASMTGEPLPAQKGEGASVYAGTVVEEGEIAIEVRATASDTKLSHIIEQIDHGDALKAAIQKRNESLADRVVPFNLGLALGTYFFTRNATKAISLLMVDYSCAIKLSTPIVVISSIKEASEKNIIVKGGKFMERFAEADAIVFDKTGTLTEATPKVKEILSFAGYSEREVLKIAACLEEHFPHSLAKAIVRKAEVEDVKHREEHTEVRYVLAHGIASTLHGKRALIGSAHFVLEDEGVSISEEVQQAIEEKSNGLSVIYLALGDELIGTIMIEDPLRTEAKSVIKGLRQSGMEHISMMTGDGRGAAEYVANQLDLDQFQWEVLPEDKSAHVKSLQEQGHQVIMVGDGINDSPALALSDVSVSLKDSSDIAKEVADITLLREDLHQLVELRQLSRGMINRIDRNLKTIIGFNSGLMAMGLLGWMSPTAIAMCHNVSTLIISGRSMRPLAK